MTIGKHEAVGGTELCKGKRKFSNDDLTRSCKYFVVNVTESFIAHEL